MRSEVITAQALKRLDNNKYLLSALVFKRVEELSKGARPLVEADAKKAKFTDIALREIAAGLVNIKSIEEIA